MMMVAANIQTRSEMTASAGAAIPCETFRARLSGRPDCCLGLRDFVEAVPTYFSHQLESGKELIVNGHDVAFEWTNHGIGHAVLPKRGDRVRRAGVNSFDLGLARHKLQPVRPNVSG